MSDEERLSAMRRKAGVGRPPPEIGRVTAATALRVAVAQGAEDVAALVALAAGVEETRVVRDLFLADAPEHALLALIEGPGSRYGMVIMDSQALAALIEIQTTGRVVPNPVEPRAPTRTDAILAADFIDRVLELFEELVGEADLPVTAAIAGFRYALPMADTRAAEMTLEDIPYRLFKLTMDLGGGAKNGIMQLLFPWDPPRDKARAPEGAPEETIAENVMDTQAEMIAVLHRLDMPLADIAALEPGSLVPVPRAALSRVRLEDVGGQDISLGRLGQVNGHRAVRLSEESADDNAHATDPAPAMPGAPARPATSALDMAPRSSDPGEADLPPPMPALDALADIAGLDASGEQADLPDLDFPAIDVAGLPDLPEPVG